MSNVLIIVEVEINRGTREVKTFSSEEAFFKFYAELSLNSIKEKGFSFEIKRINDYMEGRLYPMYIESGTSGVKLKYEPTNEGEGIGNE